MSLGYDFPKSFNDLFITALVHSTSRTSVTRQVPEGVVIFVSHGESIMTSRRRSFGLELGENIFAVK
jgi:hypothetical protein